MMSIMNTQGALVLQQHHARPSTLPSTLPYFEFEDYATDDRLLPADGVSTPQVIAELEKSNATGRKQSGKDGAADTPMSMSDKRAAGTAARNDAARNKVGPSSRALGRHCRSGARLGLGAARASWAWQGVILIHGWQPLRVRLPIYTCGAPPHGPSARVDALSTSRNGSRLLFF